MHTLALSIDTMLASVQHTALALAVIGTCACAVCGLLIVLASVISHTKRYL